jgi:hypothetical protein
MIRERTEGQVLCTERGCLSLTRAEFRAAWSYCGEARIRTEEGREMVRVLTPKGLSVWARRLVAEASRHLDALLGLVNNRVNCKLIADSIADRVRQGMCSQGTEDRTNNILYGLKDDGIYKDSPRQLPDIPRPSGPTCIQTPRRFFGSPRESNHPSNLVQPVYCVLELGKGLRAWRSMCGLQRPSAHCASMHARYGTVVQINKSKPTPHSASFRSYLPHFFVLHSLLLSKIPRCGPRRSIAS